MESHVKVLGILYVVLGSMGVLGAFIVLLIFGGLAGIVGVADHGSDAATAIPVLSGIGAFVFVLVLALSLPGLIGGVGLLRLSPWSRIFMIVISALHLLSVPIGTALGIYGLWALTRPETEALFARRRCQQAY